MRQNFDNYENEKPFEGGYILVPNGTYLAVIKRCEHITKDKDHFEVDFIITNDGTDAGIEYKDCKITMMIWNHTKAVKPFLAGRFKSIDVACGTGDKEGTDTDDWIGKIVAIVVKVEKYNNKDGKSREASRIMSVTAASESAKDQARGDAPGLDITKEDLDDLM